MVGFGSLCQSEGPSIVASRHRHYIDQGGRLMAVAASLRLNQRPYLLAAHRRRTRSRDGKYVSYPLPLVLEGSADKTHIKNQFMH